jgi:hypothetical protein
VFFIRGYALHGTVEPRNLGRAVSHGCVRLDPDNASILFSLVGEQGLDHTKVVVSEKPLPRLRKAPPALIAATERGATELRAAKAKPVEEISAVAKADHGEEKRPTAKAKHDDEVAKADHADLGRPIVMAQRDDEQAPAPKADLEIKVISAANAERTAEAQPPAPPEAKVAEPPQQDVRLPEPVPQEAKPAEPTQQEVRLPEPAPRRLAEPAPSDAKPSQHVRTDRRHASAHGDEAEVLRGREAWLRGLAHKYGFNKW